MFCGSVFESGGHLLSLNSSLIEHQILWISCHLYIPTPTPNNQDNIMDITLPKIWLNSFCRSHKISYNPPPLGNWFFHTVLVNEKTDADTTQVEPIQKVLNPIIELMRPFLELWFHFNHSVGHRLHDCRVTVLDLVESYGKPRTEPNKL